jgi:hypothetical protein
VVARQGISEQEIGASDLELLLVREGAPAPGRDIDDQGVVFGHRKASFAGQRRLEEIHVPAVRSGSGLVDPLNSMPE